MPSLIEADEMTEDTLRIHSMKLKTSGDCPDRPDLPLSQAGNSVPRDFHPPRMTISDHF
jgi:hypothetical protein